MIFNKLQLSIHWLKDKLTAKQFQVFAAVVVGLSAGAMAVILKIVVHYIQYSFNGNRLFSSEHTPYMIFLPTLGILLTVIFTQKVLNGQLDKGVSNVLYEIAKKSSYVKRHKLFSQLITSVMTVGLGGSAGLEAPIVVTGSAVGSNLATSWGLTYRDRTLLLGCGAAAGIGAVFNSPIAGVMFAMEVLLAEVTLSSFIPLIIAAACGALFSKIVLNEENLFFFRLTEPFNYVNIPFYLVLAFTTGIFSLYFVRVSHGINSRMKDLKMGPLSKAVVGGLILALIIYLFPSLFGEGYPSTKIIADGQVEALIKSSIFSGYRSEKWAIVLYVTAIVLIKPIATSVTLGAGGNGGNFAPSLFVGCHLGFVFARIINISGLAKVPEANFSIVAAAGILSGVMYAPLTGIFLIAEVTGGYELIIPLMMVSTLSYAMVQHFEPYSLEVKNMVERGDIFSRDKDRNILLLLKTENIIETNFATIKPTASLRELIEEIKHSNRNLFAVVNEDGQLEGILTLDDVREVMFDPKLYNKIHVQDLMKPPPSVLFVNESMSEVMKKFDKTNAWNLPVVDGTTYVGFISKSTIFSKYRSELISMSGD